ncbi:sulfotransferase [Desulfopila sp. IMCC35006]|uniref:sulfotransferase family protein n=1 Tax=Desulfopila sp. IMCC35006 TaxID=2569542 RepID=UPI0010AC22AB|nr:sulfotransferase [Desulfopila sp. IMCC35006]TKB26121.1 sulfotransferase [Desulfopila sp. IMCC35006]
MNHLFIIGAQRSGSTYLYHLLNTHPHVLMAQPVQPEPKFFLNDKLYAKGREFYEAAYFNSWTNETRYLGEKGTSYIETETVAQRIREFYPNARILMILRDPVQRAWSNYRFSVQHGLEPLDFKTALVAESDRLKHAAFNTSVNPYAYRRRGHYIDYIKTYLNIFDANQVCILILEEIAGNLKGVQALYRWLNIDDSFNPPTLGEIINPTNVKGEAPIKALRDLASGYQQSQEMLESYLGRRIEMWRRHWETL